MGYTRNLIAAAKRHLEAADHLNSTSRRDVAGYLYGIAAECALKQIMRKSGICQLENSARHDDPFYAHFPKLKTLLRDNAAGRHDSQILKWVQNDRFMQDWDVEMRYAPSKDVKESHVDRWCEQAKEIVQAMED